MSLRSAKNAYSSSAVETVNKGQLLVMLFDALVRDLVKSEEAIKSGDQQTAHDRLINAQDIVGELISSLDPDGFEGGHQLMSLYTFFYSELLDANVTKSAPKVMGIRSLVEPLAETWREVATMAMKTETAAENLESISVAG